MSALKDMSVGVNVVTKESQQKVGYVGIYRTDDYGGRTIPEDELLYEDKTECELDCRNDNGFVAIATVTWEEPA